MKQFSKWTMTLLTTAVIALITITPPAHAQSLSVSAAASSINPTGATVIGTVTAPALVNGMTNQIDVSIFYGRVNYGTLSSAWPNMIDVGNTYTNNNIYTNVFSQLPENEPEFFIVQATDLSGSNATTATMTFTNPAIADATYVSSMTITAQTIVSGIGHTNVLTFRNGRLMQLQ